MSWMEIELKSHSDSVQVGARSDRGERVRDRTLGLSLSQLSRFRVGVGNAIARSKTVDGPLLKLAHTLHQELFQGQLQELFVRLMGRAKESRRRLLLRLIIDDPRLQAVPWEAACKPQTSHGFLASTADLIIARGIHSLDPWEPREIRRALRVLPILAIDDQAALSTLQSVLEDHIATGAVELLDPIVGASARHPYLFERLRSGANPHVLHFLGHGGFDANKNPVIRLADDDYGEKSFLPVEVFAEELRDSFDNLRLLYLQACSGGRPGAFASAAEILTRSGVDAVVAYLWPARAEFAREASQDFYRSLVGESTGQGDVGISTQASRRTLVAKSAEGFSPVLYLRGPDSHLFDLQGRRLRPPKKHKVSNTAHDTDRLRLPFQKISRGSFSLLLGGLWGDPMIGELHAQLRAKLSTSLTKLGYATEASQPMHAIAQRFVLKMGFPSLSRMFQRIISANYQQGEASPLIDALGAILRPGVHTTLLWLPLLEHAIARHHPNATIVVIQPGPRASDERRLVVAKEPHQDDWEELLMIPELDLAKTFVVLRLYGGYTAEGIPILASPQLTEDDHIQGLFDMQQILPSEWADEILGWVRTHPVMCFGMSALDWRHRTLLRRVFDQRPVPRGSLAVLGEDQDEEELWAKRSAGLPGTSNFSVVRSSIDALCDAIRGSQS